MEREAAFYWDSETRQDVGLKLDLVKQYDALLGIARKVCGYEALRRASAALPPG
jgi:hypothetical protein